MAPGKVLEPTEDAVAREAIRGKERRQEEPDFPLYLALKSSTVDLTLQKAGLLRSLEMHPAGVSPSLIQRRVRKRPRYLKASKPRT